MSGSVQTSAIVASVLLALPSVLQARAGEPLPLTPEVQETVAWAAGVPSRVVGTPGHDEVIRRLQEDIRAISGVTVWTQSFSVVMPQADASSLTVDAGPAAGTHAVYPLWPSGVRLQVTPPEGISGELVYVGKARFEDIPVSSVRGQIAVMEMGGGINWQTLFAAGARAVVLLGSGDDTYQEVGTHLVPISVNFPRFYVPDGDLARALRSGPRGKGTILAKGAWREVRAMNTYALIGRGSEGARAICVAVPVDSMSTIPELAPGADGAVDMGLALGLLRRWAADPPPRPVLFAFLDAFAEDEAGLREMLLALGTLPSTRDMMQKDDQESRRTYRHQVEQLAKLEAGGLASKGARGESAGDAPPARLHEPAFRDLHSPVKEEVQRQVLEINARLMPMRLRRPKVAAGERDAMDAEIAELEQRAGALRRSQASLILGRSSGPEDAALRAEVWSAARARVLGQQADMERLFALDASRDELRKSMLAALGWRPGDMEKGIPLAFVLGLDLSDAGCAAGPMLYDGFLAYSEQPSAGDFLRWFRRMAGDNLRLLPEPLRKAVESGPVTGTESPSSYAVGRVGTLTGALRTFGLPGVTWATLEGERIRVDTPNDRGDRLDWNRLGVQVEATARLLDAWVRDPAFTVSPLTLAPNVQRARGGVMDQAEGEAVARIPMSGYVAVLVPGSGNTVLHLAIPGMRSQEVAFTGVDGRFRFDAVPPRNYWGYRVTAEAYRLDEAGRPVRAVNRIARGDLVSMNFAPTDRKPKAMRAVAFTCEEISVAGIFDPRFLMPLGDVSVLDAWRGDAKRLNVNVWNGLLSAFVEPDRPWQLVARAGSAGNRLMLANVMPSEESEGVPPHLALRGFRPGDPLPAHPFEVATRDFLNLDTRRMIDYRKAGVASRTLEDIQDNTRSALHGAAGALERNDGEGYFRRIATALSNETRAYGAVRATANDVIRGVVLLLLLLVPCAYALERLLVASTGVYRQLACSAGIFVLLAGLLWSFHPAFRMGGAPMMILLAFGVILLSLMVLRMVYEKFDEELKKLRSRFAESSGAVGAGMKLAGTQVRLALANMRRRPLRTALTGITVMLVTFSLLCFMSTSAYVQSSQYTIPGHPGRPSVLVRLPGYAPLNPLALEHIRLAAGGESRAMAARYWWCNAFDPQWRAHVRHEDSGRVIPVAAVIGFDAQEAAVSGIDRILPDWEAFQRGDGCYLAAETAAELKAKPGDRLAIAGKSLTLLGLFDSRRFDDEARAIDGHALLPPDYSMMDPNERGERQKSGIEDLFVKLQAGMVEEPASRIPDLRSRQVAIVPSALLQGMRGSLRSVALAAADEREAARLASAFSETLAFPIYHAGLTAVKVLVARPLAPKAPRSLFIPLLIAALIIFNTMLSSIAERRQEIYVYTSLGLAPFHIGMMFVAEALTYGVLGAITGYVGGQGLATVFGRLGWMGGMTLNFGGTQAALTMLLVLGIVTLSSLVPAWLAGKLAAPSNKMSWSVPDAVEEQGRFVIRDQLPFTATDLTAPGVLAFMHEYLDALRDGTIGHMTTADLAVYRRREEGKPEALGLAGTVWLAPYDMGVRQSMKLELRQDERHGDLYAIHVELTHESGTPRSWHRLNRQCLSDLRRQLLGWRKVGEERVWAYIDRGRALRTTAVDS